MEDSLQNDTKFVWSILGIQSGPRCGPLWWSKGCFIERFVITVGLWKYRSACVFIITTYANKLGL